MSNFPKLFAFLDELITIKVVSTEDGIDIEFKVVPVGVMLSKLVGSLLISKGIGKNKFKNVHSNYNLNSILND